MQWIGRRSLQDIKDMSDRDEAADARRVRRPSSPRSLTSSPGRAHHRTGTGTASVYEYMPSYKF